MPRPRGDHEERRREVSAAVWRVVAAGGFGSLSLRTVAAELGATTGTLTHYFSTKRDLVRYAVDLLAEQTAMRRRSHDGSGILALREALVEMLPLDEESTTTNRVWVSSWDIALADAELAADHARRYAAGRERLRQLVDDAQRTGELPPGDDMAVATRLHAFVLGLVVLAVLDPISFPASVQVSHVEGVLAALSGDEDELPLRRRGRVR